MCVGEQPLHITPGLREDSSEEAGARSNGGRAGLVSVKGVNGTTFGGKQMEEVESSS